MRWYLLLIILVVTFTGVQSAQACSCVPPPSPREALDASDAVFYGQVTQTRRDDQLFATFRVQRAWKGDLDAEVVVTTALNSAACGVGFQEGKEYLVYASMSEGRLVTHLCTRTTQAENAEADMEALGDGTVLSQKDTPRGGCGGLTNIGTLQGMFFIFLWIGFRRRRHG